MKYDFMVILDLNLGQEYMFAQYLQVVTETIMKLELLNVNGQNT